MILKKYQYKYIRELLSNLTKNPARPEIKYTFRSMEINELYGACRALGLRLDIARNKIKIYSSRMLLLFEANAFEITYVRNRMDF